jgi:hypothetical protein
MKEAIFLPRYTIRGSWDVLSLSLLLTVALLFSIARMGFSSTNIIGIIFLVLGVIKFSDLYLRRIVFTPSDFLVESYFRPSRRIKYSDVIDLGFSKVKTRRGDVSFAGMSNAALLHHLFSELIREGIINNKQFENKVFNEEITLEKSFWPAMASAVVLEIGFLLMWSYYGLRLNSLVIWGSVIVTCLLVFSVVFTINKSRLGKK